MKIFFKNICLLWFKDFEVLEKALGVLGGPVEGRAGPVASLGGPCEVLGDPWGPLVGPCWVLGARIRGNIQQTIVFKHFQTRLGLLGASLGGSW